MKKEILLAGSTLLAAGMMAPASPAATSNADTVNIQIVDRVEDKKTPSTPLDEVRSGWKRRRFGRLSGPENRYLNQRQRRKLEAQTGRKIKRR